MVLTSLDTSELAVNRQTLRKGGVDFSMPGGGGGGGGLISKNTCNYVASIFEYQKK